MLTLVLSGVSFANHQCALEMESELTTTSQEVTSLTSALAEWREDHDKLIETEAAIMLKYQAIIRKKQNAKANNTTIHLAIQELKEKIQTEEKIKNDHKRARSVLQRERIKTTEQIEKELEKLSADGDEELQVYFLKGDIYSVNIKTVFRTF